MDNWIDLKKNNYINKTDCNDLCAILIEESDSLNAKSMDNIISWLKTCYANPDDVNEAIQLQMFETEADFFRTKFPTDLNIKSGDFGEAIAHYIMEKHPNLNFKVPVFKLRYKRNPNKSSFGSDIKGFKYKEEHGIDAICTGEIKSGITKKYTVIQDACFQLINEFARDKEIEQIARIAHDLQQGKNNEFKKLIRFFKDDSFSREFIFIGLFDIEHNIKRMFEIISEPKKIKNKPVKTLSFKAVQDNITFYILPIKDYRDKLVKAYE